MSPDTLSSASKSDTEAPGKRERAKAANRQAILDAARAVFAELGYEATTVRDIIRRTDLASGTFYNYFKSKDEIVQALADDGVRRFRPLLAAVRERATGFEAYVREALRAHFQFLADENADSIAQSGHASLLTAARTDTPEMRAIFEEVRADIDAAIARGEGPSDLDADFFTAAAMGVAREVGDRMLMRRPVDVDAATRFASELLFAGVGAHKR